MRVGKGIGGGPCPLVILYNPVGNAVFLTRHPFEEFRFALCRRCMEVQLFSFCQGEQYGAVQQDTQLLRGQLQDFLLVPTLLQLLIAVH